MKSIRGHFDGKAVILDEPADLQAGQRVRVTVEVAEESGNAEANAEKAPRGYGTWKGKITMSEDFDEPLDDFSEYR